MPSPGFGIWMANFRDVLTDPKANALLSDFVARKIRQRVKDPKTAETLIPKCHGFGTRRVPQETGFYEAFNLPHVRLVDVRETPIERVTPSRHQDQRRRPRVRHHRLRHRLRRHHRQLRPDRLPRRRRPAAEGQVEGRAEDLPRPDVGGLPQHADAGRAAQRLHPLQHPALHRAERGVGDGPDALPCATAGSRGSRRRRRRRPTGRGTSRSWPRACSTPRSIPGRPASTATSRARTCGASCSTRAARRPTASDATRWRLAGYAGMELSRG